MNKRNLPYSFLIAVLVVVGFEIYSARAGRMDISDKILRDRFYATDKLPSIDDTIVQWQTAHLFKRRGEYFDVLFLGDSSCLMGISPKAFEARSKRSALNLGTLGWLASEGHSDLLRLYLTELKAPKTIVYHVTPVTLTRSAQAVEKMGVLRRFRTWQFSLGIDREFGSVWFKPWTLMPSFRWRGRISFEGESTKNWDSEPRGSYPSDVQMRDALFESRGMLEEAAVWTPKPMEEPMAKVTPEAIHGIRKISAMAQKNGAKLFICFGPVPKYWQTPEITEWYGRLEDALAREFEGELEGVIPVRFYSDECFGSPNHLIPACAERNSTDIADVLAGK